MGSTSPPPPKRIRSNTICIIGAGPSGLAAAKYLRAEQAFSKIVIFEQRDHVGGLWNHTDVDRFPEDFPIPQTDPFYNHGDSTDGKHSSFLTPLYDRLETNIPRGLMGFSDLDWPEDSSLFPKHDAVLAYLERYAADVTSMIEFETQVLDVRLSDDEQWLVTTRQLTGEAGITRHTFDAVVVASGHFDVPSIPPVKGIEDFNAAHPGVITHSKFFRRPEVYKGQKVIVVGNSASGSDIGAQISKYCAKPMLLSTRSESLFVTDQSTYQEKPEIVEFIPSSRGVMFSDGSLESDIDAVLYCTGYFYSYPFLGSLQDSEAPLISSGERVQNLYQHIFYRPHPTLSFLVLNQKVIPFPVAEVQSAVIAKVLSGQLALPSDTDMIAWEKQVVAKNGSGRMFHVLKFPEDANYINMLHNWAVGKNSATYETNGSNGQGKTPPYWSEKDYWTRERFPAIKKAYQDFGDKRIEKRTLQDVGYDFEGWKEGQDQL